MIQKPPFKETDISKMMADFGKKISSAVKKLSAFITSKITPHQY
jgi:uncharacterized protein YneF (UPF0154 family)